MTFRVHLFTGNDAKLEISGVEFTGSSGPIGLEKATHKKTIAEPDFEFREYVDFPNPGRSVTVDFKPFSSVFNLGIRLGKTRQPFVANRLGEGDTLALVYLPSRLILGNIVHGQALKKAPPCEVQCPDGRVAQNCITCEIDGHTVKICC